MSLINDALKKAQKQRTGETPSLTAMPSVGGESAARIARRGKPAGFNTLVTWIGVGVVALAAVIASVVFLLRSKAPAPVAPASLAKTAPTSPAPQPAPSSTATVVAAPAPTIASVTPPPTPAPVVQAAPPVATPPPVVAAAVQPSSTIVLAPAPAPEPPKPAAPSVAHKLENRAINYIDSIRVAGIRASGTDSKVLMNDRVYRIGDLVEAEMGLRLAGITTNSLTFEDEKGGRYTRNF